MEAVSGCTLEQASVAHIALHRRRINGVHKSDVFDDGQKFEGEER